MTDLREAAEMALEALRDMHSGWEYIRDTHGDLYGVGWDRAQGKAEEAMDALCAALDAQEPKPTMTRDDIIRMAREAGVLSGYESALFQRFAALVAAAERDRCVKIIEGYEVPVGNSSAGELAAEWTMDALRDIRDEIRSKEVQP